MWKFENQFTLQNYLAGYNEIFMKVSGCMTVKMGNVLLLTIDIVDGESARLPLQGRLGSHVNSFLNFLALKFTVDPSNRSWFLIFKQHRSHHWRNYQAPLFHILFFVVEFHTRICGNKASMSKHQKTFHWVMQDRDKRFFCRFFFIFDSSPTLANDSDFVDLLLRNFLLRKLQKLSVDEALSNCSRSNFCKSFSVCEGFSDFRKTSLIKSGWLFSSDREEVQCLTKVLCLHALACGKELGRTAKEWCLVSVYVPPDRSSRNSSSSDELMRSSASEDWRESDCWVNWYKFLSSFNSSCVHSPGSFYVSAATFYSKALRADRNAVTGPGPPVLDCRCSAATRCSSFPQSLRFLPCSLTQKIVAWVSRRPAPSSLTTSDARTSSATNTCQVTALSWEASGRVALQLPGANLRIHFHEHLFWELSNEIYLRRPSPEPSRSAAWCIAPGSCGGRWLEMMDCQSGVRGSSSTPTKCQSG